MPTLIYRCCAIGLLLALAACSDSSDNHRALQPEFDFSEVDARLQQFLDEDVRYEGISYTLVDRHLGTIYEAALGDHTVDLITMLASTSKVPSVMLLMALDDDASLDFDIEAPVENYLPWQGVYGDRTVSQMLSHTSGIPGLGGLADYGPHGCQFLPNIQLQDCAQVIYAYEVPGTQPAGTVFDYGGSQWQLAGAVAEVVSGSTWTQAFDEYIAEPCDLEVFQYGNQWSSLGSWNGSPDSLVGQENAHIEGGAVSSLQDYAKILLMHLNDGMCGDSRVLSAGAVSEMRVDRAGHLGVPYGMGWWIRAGDEGSEPTVFYDPGLFGAIAWIDIERGIGGFLTVDNYRDAGAGGTVGLVLNEIIDMVAAEVDRARMAAGQ